MEKRNEIEERLILLSQMKKISGFSPSIIEHYTDAKEADVVTVLNEWIAAGKLSVRYLLRNPEHDTEKKTFANLEDIPFGEWYDEFQIGDEFQVDMDDIEKEYFFAEHQLTERPKPEPVIRPTHIDGVPIEVLDYLKAIRPYKERIQEKQSKYGITEEYLRSDITYRFDGKEYTSAQVGEAYDKERAEN